MASVKTILVPLDLDGHTRRVLDFGRTLADAFGASLHLLHVISCPMADQEARAAHHLDASTRLNALLDTADREVRKVTTSCVFGVPAPEIARYAADHGVDVIVMGTHCHGQAFQMLTGSIAETVMGMVPCAVLTVKCADWTPDVNMVDPQIEAIGEP